MSSAHDIRRKRRLAETKKLREREAEAKRKERAMGPPPACPPYLRLEEYEALLEMRRSLA